MGAGPGLQYHLDIVKDINIAAACVDEGGGDQGPCFLIIPRGCVVFEPNPVSCLVRVGGGFVVAKANMWHVCFRADMRFSSLVASCSAHESRLRPEVAAQRDQGAAALWEERGYAGALTKTT